MSRDLESGGKSREKADAERGSGAKDLPEAGCLLGRVGAGEVAEQEKGDFDLQRSPWRDEVPRDLPEAGEYAPL